MRSRNLPDIDVFHGAAWENRADLAALHPKTNAEAQATFLQGMLDMPTQRGRRNPVDWVVSFSAHIAILGVVVITPLLFTPAIDPHSTEAILLVAPRPPAASPPAPAVRIIKAGRPAASLFHPSKFIAPTVIPAKIKIVADEAPPPDPGAGVVGRVPGGAIGGIIGGVADDTVTVEPPPQSPPPRKILRVGGEVKEPVALSRPEPTYPAVARVAHVEGVVVIEAIIDERGNVTEAEAVDGPPLLVRAALEAVSEWKYEPTILNGEPVAIRTRIRVAFHLH